MLQETPKAARPWLVNESRPYAQVMRQRKANESRNWCTVGHGQASDEPASARNRLLSGEAVIVESKPRFKIEPGALVYTIGSCFARNVERALQMRGFNIPTASLKLPDEMYAGKTLYKNSVLNKFNAYSMAAEIHRGIDPGADPGLIEVSDGLWYDPQTSFVAFLKHEAVALRWKLDKLAQKALTADTILLTLGLTETWFDRQTGQVFNALNVMAVRDRQKQEQIGFFNATPDQVVQVLSDAFDALRAANPGVRIVMTVSPVPMQATFTEMDVISANTYSKAVLRVACEMLRAKYDFVDYFPSYEMVTHSPRGITWVDDQIHVHPDVIAKVIGAFAERYIAEPAKAPA